MGSGDPLRVLAPSLLIAIATGCRREPDSVPVPAVLARTRPGCEEPAALLYLLDRLDPSAVSTAFPIPSPVPALASCIGDLPAQVGSSLASDTVVAFGLDAPVGLDARRTPAEVDLLDPGGEHVLPAPDHRVIPAMREFDLASLPRSGDTRLHFAPNGAQKILVRGPSEFELAVDGAGVPGGLTVVLGQGGPGTVVADRAREPVMPVLSLLEGERVLGRATPEGPQTHFVLPERLGRFRLTLRIESGRPGWPMPWLVIHRLVAFLADGLDHVLVPGGIDPRNTVRYVPELPAARPVGVAL